jgi:hypothetical protein
MNKQIVRKHLISAIIEVDGIRTDDADLNEELEKMYVPDCFAEKFAEMIVRECEQVSLKHSHRDDDMGAIIARHIKEHFGIGD